jgi:hypothetical protein
LKNDREIVLAAVTQNSLALKFTSDELKNDHEIVVAAVNQNARAFQYASDEMKNDREIVLAAMNQNGDALKHASDELKNDREIVLAAVKNKGTSLCFVSKELKNDCEILIVAFANGCTSYLSTAAEYEVGIFLDNMLLQCDRFQSIFLMGWMYISPKESHEVVSLLANKLPLLNKLGKYGSIQVKKLIADYAGVYHGERLMTARTAFHLIEKRRKRK